MNPSSNTFVPSAYWEERLRNNPGITGVGYTSLGRNFNQWQYRVRRRVFLRLLNSLRTDWEEADVLDVGSGTGFYVNLWKELGVKSLRGSDLTETAISRLNREFPDVRFSKIDIGDSPTKLLSERFDVISALDVLFHIVEDCRYGQAISNIYSLLRPGGVFIFSDLLLHGPTQRSLHMVSRSFQQVEQCLEASGFDVILRVPMFVLMNLPADTDSQIRRMTWRLFVFVIRRSEIMGQIFGSLLYPLELVLTSMLKESTSTEIVVCRKRPVVARVK